MTEHYLKQLQAYQNIISGTIYCCLEDIYLCNLCKKYNLKYFYKYPVQSYYELSGLKDLGVSYIRLAAPLFFDLKNVNKFGIPIRVTPNKAYDAYIPRKNGIFGTWIRPEDLNLYEKYVSICEFRIYDILFEGNPQIYEKTLLRIYRDLHEWNGDLKDIVKDIGVDVKNSTIHDAIGKRRLNCRQICQSKNHCHICEASLNFSNIVKKYKEKKTSE